MLFNSINFAIFLPIVFTLYWFFTQNNLKLQNLLLLISSYFFYACWDWRFLFLLMFSTFLDFFTGLKISQAKHHKSKNIWFWISISVNLGFLGVFKYYNFFAESFASALNNIGLHVNLWTIKVILPVGISFYTFHGLSYIIDLYKNKIKAENNLINYSVFVSFFPLLVAGPIERATHLLPQIQKKRVFDYSKAVDGLRQILWGLFKKVVIADQCAEVANQVFNNYSDYSGSTLFLGIVFFTFQIYCDFSGYSDIALGTARATFFCVGNNVVQYPEIYQQITDRGHSIGNHTMHHVKGFKTPWKMYVKDVILAQQYIPSSLFRPPYGQLTRYQAKALKQLGYKLIFWDVISYDYLQEPLTDAHANALLQQIRPGSIVLFHDSNKAYLRLQVLLPKVLEYCKIHKYQLNNL